ncbi:hypothetical protein [Chitinophaga sp. S165]|uniref:hypothetical protein n=1 Tax=Chitinophaga sp. S165 TaxID=2135462 RepID=UPI000D99ECD5|nr:hypothetical protein [Chitinophaga sp. S165]PWV56698.1 hypothetical protein C7475_1011215 [Chitinophaga sp. S165]
MYRMYKRALPAMACLMVWLMPAAFADPLIPRVFQDSLPNDLATRSLSGQPALKSAVVNAINNRTPGLHPQDTVSPALPFNKFGLSGLNPGARMQFVQYMNAGNTATGITKMQGFFDGMKDSSKQARYIDNKLRGFYALKGQQLPGNLSLPGKPENKLKGASWTSTYSDSTAMMSGWWNEGVVQDVFSVGSIPFQLNYSTLSGYDYSNAALQDAHFMKISFNREEYMNKINQQLQKKYDLKKYFLEDLDVKSSMKKYAGDQLSAIKGNGDSTRGKLSPDQIMYLDSTQLSNVLINQGDTSGGYYNKIMALKKQLGGVKEMNQMLGSEKRVKGNIEGWLQQPQNTSRVAGDLLHLSPLQRLMMNMKDLKVGSIGANASKGTMSDLFMTGAAGSFLKSNKFIMLAAGKSNELGVQDAGLQSATGRGNYSMQFIRLGRGDIGSKQSHVSVLNANSKPQQQYGFNTSAISRNVFVGSVSQQIGLGELGTLDFELSKSSSQFGNNSQDAAAVSKSAAGQFLDDIWATASIGMAYNGDVKKIGLTHKVYVNYAGLGYVNPGAPFASRGTLQYGFNVKRTWLRNKATVSLRTDMRNLPVSPLTDNKRKSQQYAFDARYRFTRRFTLGMNLLQNTLKETTEGEKHTAFLNRKISFTSQANGKIGGKPFSNNSSLGLQQLNYMQPDAPLKSLFVNAASMQTWMAGPGMVMVSAMYSRDVKNAAVYNNLLNTEGGYQYTLWKLSCGSSLIYMDSKDVVTQIGLRQQVAAQLLKHWSLSISADGRHNLRNTSANYYYGKFNTAMSLNYQIN